MRISAIEFDDAAFKACALATGFENTEDVVKLVCRNKGIRSTKGLEYFTGLKLLDVTRNQLEQLDVSNNLLLEELFAGNNELQSLDVSKNTKLTHLEVFINELTEIDVRENTQLAEIYANKNELSTIDLSNNAELTDVRLSGNDIEQVDFGDNDKLEKVFLDKNPISDEMIAMLKNKLQNVEFKI